MPTITDNLNLFKPDPGQSGVAAELNGNWDQLDFRFDEAGGHTHDGTPGQGPKVPVTSIAATGTPSASTVLRGDGQWAPPTGGGTGVTDHGALTGLTDDDHSQYFNQSRGDTRYTQRTNNLSDVSNAATARTNLGAAAASHQHDAAAITTGTIATARLGSGSGGLDKFLRIDQTWAVPGAGGSVNLDDLADVLITAPSDNQVLSYDAAGARWINETPAAPPAGLTNEDVDDRVNALLVAGTGITKTYDDTANTLTLAASGGAMATDPIWDAAGDLAVGSGANTAARLAAGTAGHVLTSTGSGVGWQAPSGATPVDPVTTLQLVDDFFVAAATSGQIGALGWVADGGSSAIRSGVLNHPGVFERVTGGTINTNTALMLASVSLPTHLVPTHTFDMTWILKLVDQTNTILRVGLTETNANPPASGIFIEKLDADTSWFGVCRSSVVQSRTAALAAVNTTNWFKFRIRRINGTTIGFSVDGGTELTLATNVPTTALTPMLLWTNTAAASKAVQIDLFALTVTGLVR